MTSPNSPGHNFDPDQQVRRTNLGQTMVSDALNAGEMPVITVPRINLDTNLPLRWGEWIGIAFTACLGIALFFEALFVIGTLDWFDDTRHVLLPFGPLLLVIGVATVIMRLPEAFPVLRRLARTLLVLGSIVTALILIRTQVFPTYAPDDWSWVRAFSDLASLDAETPHAIIGMIALSVLIWIFASSLAQNGGDYVARRNVFLRLFAILIVALVLGLLTVRDEVAFSATLALYLPAYTLLGLITLSQVRLVEVRAQMTRTGAGGRRAFGIWRLVTVGLALTSLILVFVVTAIFYGGSYQQAIADGLTVWGHITDVLATIIIWLTLPIVEALSAFTPHPPTTQTPQGCVLPTETPGATPTGATVPTSTPTVTCNPGNQINFTNGSLPISVDEAHLVYITVLAVFFLVLALIIFLRTRKALGMAKAGEYEEERERLDLRGNRQTRPQPAPALGIIDAPAPGTARAAYQSFLQASASIKLPREPNETPAEFQDRVRPEIGDAALETTVEDLTAGYEAERYGGEQLPAVRLTGLQEAARVISAAFARLRGRK